MAGKFEASGRCLVVRTSFPWWGLVCGWLGLMLAKIVLCNPSLARLAKAYFPRLYVHVMDEKDALRVPKDELDGVRVICLERAPMDMTILSEVIHRGRHLEAILISRWKYAYKWRSPRHWRVTEVKVALTAVGGVTDAVCRFFVIRKVQGTPGGDRDVMVADRPARDERSILKMARPGIKSAGPGELPFKAASSAVFVSPGVMSCAGIIPYPKRTGDFRKFAPRVLTRYGGDMWVTRNYEAKELLMAGDVPEKLIHLASLAQQADSMVDVMDWPVKMLQAVAEGVEGILDEDASFCAVGCKRTRKCEDLVLLNAEVKRMQLKEPEENEFRDVESCESQTGIEPGREGPGLEDDKHQAKAVKNDNAAVRTKDWDFFLALGLAEEVRARKWREAATKIRPLAMRWWRRHQLHKCLKYKRYKTIPGEFTEYDRGVMVDAIGRMTAVTWWSWNNGSRPFYWAWDDNK
jgi:hypothetical protein